MYAIIIYGVGRKVNRNLYKAATETKTGGFYASRPIWLPAPKHPIPIDFDGILQAFQHVGYMGELKQRWLEIKKLQHDPTLFVTA